MMWRKTAKLFSLVLLLLLGVVSANAAEKSVSDVKNLTLAQAQEIALKNNLQIELAALGVEKAELALEQANFAAQKMNKAIDNGMGKDQNADWVINIVPKQAQSGKTIAEIAVGYTENSIKYGVEAAYYGVLGAQKMLEVSQISYKRTQEQLKQAQARFGAGTCAKVDVISAEAQLKSAEAAVNNAETSLKAAKMNLNKTLNLNLDSPLKLAEQFTFDVAQSIDINKTIKEMMEKDLTLVTAQEGYHISSLEYEYYKKYYTPNTFMYRDAAYKLKEAEVKLNNAKSELELNIRNAYWDLKTAEENYHVYSKSLEQGNEVHRLNKLRYQVGMATIYDVLSTEAALKQAELGLLNALYNYNLAKAKFNYGVFLGSSGASSLAEQTIPAGSSGSGMSDQGV
ncbi:MAG: TolC family protein [Bacillota bacterium]|jgi:outer membrane protein